MLQQLINNAGSEMVITAVVGSIGPIQQTKNGKNYQVVRLQDGQSVADAKIFQGNGQPLQPSMTGQTLTFKLANKPYRGQASIAGYWQASANTLQQPQQALNNLAPLTQPAQATNGELSEKRRIKAMSIAYAKDLVVAGKEEDLEATANNIYRWIWFDQPEHEDEPEPPI